MTDHVRLTPMARVRIRLGGETIADTTQGYVVREGTLPPRYYVPRAEVRGELIATDDGASCPWKGTWRHLDLVAGDRRVPRAAWTYYEVTPVCAPIRDFIAFYADKVDIDVE